MDKSHPNLTHNPLQPFKSKENNKPQKAKGMSIYAFMLITFIYTTISYIFNLSPSNHFKDSKFLFFVSSTLFIIIVVDYGVFSKDYKQLHGQIEEHKIRRPRSVQVIANTCILQEEVDHNELHVKIKSTQLRIRVPENRLAFAREIEHGVCGWVKGDNYKKPLAYDKGKNDVVPSKPSIKSSKSSVVKRVAFDESKNTIRVIETDNYEQMFQFDYNDHGEDDEEGNDEEITRYASLSDAELNKRVEEFVERFNKQT